MVLLPEQAKISGDYPQVENGSKNIILTSFLTSLTPTLSPRRGRRFVRLLAGG
jgi:hypothetical protein